jgi:hypothetical protein
MLFDAELVTNPLPGPIADEKDATKQGLYASQAGADAAFSQGVAGASGKHIFSFMHYRGLEEVMCG